MNKAFVVAKWEYLEKVKSKAFVISLFMTPAMMLLFGVLPTFFAQQEEDVAQVIGIVDQAGSIAPEFSKRMEERYRLPDDQPRYLVRWIRDAQASAEKLRSEADAMVLRDEIVGYLVIGNVAKGDSVIEYRAKHTGDFRLSKRAEDILRQILSEQRAAARGLDPKLISELRVPLDLSPVKLSESGKEEKGGFEKVFLSAYVFLMMLFFLIFTSGQLLVRSVIEEKSNRIVEILVSSCSPTELMAGKVLGLSALGFTQLAFWGIMGLALSLQFGFDLVDPVHALLLTVYFVLGYLFYAAVFIALGSPLTTEQEAQQVNSYLVIVLIIPLVLALPAIQNPNAGWISVLTYIPLLTPTMMALRIPIQMPSALEIVATIVLMLVSIYGAMWIAGRIFRIAILSTGKRPSMREVFAWIRNG